MSVNFAQEEEWLEAELETVTSLISSEYLRVDSEYQVFTATMAWIHHDIANRYNNKFIRDSNEDSRRFYNQGEGLYVGPSPD